jgi:hypothetical protein
MGNRSHLSKPGNATWEGNNSYKGNTSRAVERFFHVTRNSSHPWFRSYKRHWLDLSNGKGVFVSNLGVTVTQERYMQECTSLVEAVA